MATLEGGQAAAGAPWPGGCCGAVSLTFDDGLASQWRLAVPLLEAHGLRGTFYLNPSGTQWAERLAPWREVAAHGHELGNHTCGHPCARGFQSSPGARGLEDMTLEELSADIDLAEQRLAALSGTGGRSFAYPCYQDHVGEGVGRRSYVPLIAQRFVAGRGRGEVANHPATADLHALWSFPVERCSGAALVGLAERAARQGRWAILTFHGVDEGHLPVAQVDLRELCEHLRARQSDIWTAPVAEVAAAIAAWRRGVRPRAGC